MLSASDWSEYDNNTAGPLSQQLKQAADDLFFRA